jgi:hypothetical protein
MESWNGTEWSVQSVPSPSGASATVFLSVSCSSSTACAATGDYTNSSGTVVTLVERWNGTAWSVQSTPNPSGATTSVLAGVWCSSSTACVAAGYDINSSGKYVPLAESWNGTEWSIKATPSPSGAQTTTLSGVSCTSPTSCTATGDYLNGSGNDWETLAERWNGTEWTIQTTPNPTGSTVSVLTSVSCTSSTACTATGYANSSGVYVTLAERWNGSTWSVQTTPNPTGAKASYLRSVACTSTVCTATGEYLNSSGTTVSLAEWWNGTEWSVQTTPNPNGAKESTLAATSCFSSSTCTSVGSYINNTGITTNLAEGY